MEEILPAEAAAEFTELMTWMAKLRSSRVSGIDTGERSFRDNLGRFPTGVVLITAMGRTGPVGMAVNSFTSVSLDPPLVSFCPMSSSATWAAIRDVGGFAVTILRDNHSDVSTLFARRGADKFGAHDWVHTPSGHPILKDALGWIDASIEVVHAAGDHDLVIARAAHWSTPGTGDPLVFYSGGYRNLASN